MARGRPQVPEAAQAKSGSNQVRKDSPTGCALPRRTYPCIPEVGEQSQTSAKAEAQPKTG